MSRISIPALDASPAGSQATLDAVHQKLGVIPNLFRLMGGSPAALTGFVSLQSALSKTLDVKTHERIALAIAQVHNCNYCLSAHTYLGLNLAKLTPEEIMQNRKGASADIKANAAVEFAVKVAKERGHVSNSDIEAVHNAGFTDSQIVEIIALVAENSFTNYLNNVAKTEIDFPEVDAL